MSQDQRVSEEMLGAFVDGQLDGADWAAVAQAVDGDERLREEVCRLRTVKELVRHAYAEPRTRPARELGRRRAGWLGLAASSLAFAMAGWFGHAQWNSPPALDAASAYALRGDWHSLHGDWGSLQEGKVLVHVSSSGREALSAALDEVEDLLRDAAARGRNLELEIVANGPGLDLFRASDAQLAGRLADLRRAHPRVSFVACGQTIDRRRATGQAVELIEGTQVATSALNEVVERLRAGWIYVRA
jgi:hypothetical protein